MGGTVRSGEAYEDVIVRVGHALGCILRPAGITEGACATRTRGTMKIGHGDAISA